jgi:hypothetical protein
MYPARQNIKDLVEEMRREVLLEAQENNLKFKPEEKKVLIKKKLVEVFKTKKKKNKVKVVSINKKKAKLKRQLRKQRSKISK